MTTLTTKTLPVMDQRYIKAASDELHDRRMNSILLFHEFPSLSVSGFGKLVLPNEA